MKILDSVLARFGYQKEKAKELQIRDPNFGVAKFVDINTADLDNPYAQHAWVYACIKRIAQNVASVPLKLYQGDVNNPKLIENGPLYEVFNRPNNQWTKYHLIESIVTHLSLDGNALWVLDRERPTAEPREIWTYSKKRFKPRLVDNTVISYEWRKNNKERIILKPYQVIIFRYFGLNGSFWGMGPLQAAMMSAEQDHLASLFNKAFFENGAQAGGVLSVKTAMGAEEKKAYREMFNAQHQGSPKAFKTLLLQGDVDYKQIEVKHKDMCFEDQKKWSRDEICACFGVPKAELSVYEDINYATARSADKSFWQKTLIPICRLIEDTLRAQFFIPYDQERTWAQFDLSVVEALQQDFGEKLKRAKTLFDMGVPFNQVNNKLELGFEDIPSGDVGYLPVSLVEAGTQPDYRSISAQQGDDAKGYLPTVQTKNKPIHTPQQEAMWKQFVRSLSTPERKFNEGIRRYLNRVKTWLTKQLDGFDVPKDIPADALRLADEWDDELKTLAGMHYEKVAVSYGPVIEEDLRAAGISFRFNHNDPRLVDYLRIKENKIVGINERIRETVRDTVAEGVRKNETMAELQKEISAVMGETKSRSLRIARTETASAANGLEFECFKQAGITNHMWLAALDEVTRDSHIEAMAMGPIPLGNIFGPTGCRYPGDENGAPEEIINCRCTLLAVE